MKNLTGSILLASGLVLASPLAAADDIYDYDVDDDGRLSRGEFDAFVANDDYDFRWDTEPTPRSWRERRSYAVSPASRTYPTFGTVRR